SFAVELDFTGTTPSTKSLDLWVGTGCDDPVARQNGDAGMCHQIMGPTLTLSALQQNHYATPEVPFYDLIEAKPSQQAGGSCETTLQGSTVSIFAMGAINSSSYDY